MRPKRRIIPFRIIHALVFVLLTSSTGPLLAQNVPDPPTDEPEAKKIKKSYKIEGKRRIGFRWQCTMGRFKGLAGGPHARKKEAKQVAKATCRFGLEDDEADELLFGPVGVRNPDGSEPLTGDDGLLTGIDEINGGGGGL